MGIPVLVCEFAIGRGSRYSVAAGFEELEPKGSRWHHTKWIGIIGSYLLMMFYTTVGGWMMYYCFRSVRGDFVGATPDAVEAGFADMLGSPGTLTMWTVLKMCIRDSCRTHSKTTNQNRNLTKINLVKCRSKWKRNLKQH